MSRARSAGGRDGKTCRGVDEDVNSVDGTVEAGAGECCRPGAGGEGLGIDACATGATPDPYTHRHSDGAAPGGNTVHVHGPRGSPGEVGSNVDHAATTPVCPGIEPLRVMTPLFVRALSSISG
jgi:hypothetical protein